MQKSFNDRISTHLPTKGSIKKDTNKKASKIFIIDFVETVWVSGTHCY